MALKQMLMATLVGVPLLSLQQIDACNDPSEDPREAVTDGGTWFVTYAPDPDPIPFDQTFALDVSVFDNADHTDLVEDAGLKIDATMPSHGHGMIVTPKVTPNGDGTFRVDNMRFHMEGEWEIEMDISRGGVTETAIFPVNCCD